MRKKSSGNSKIIDDNNIGNMKKNNGNNEIERECYNDKYYDYLLVNDKTFVSNQS